MNNLFAKTQEELKTIKSVVDASDFHYWLMEHPEVEEINGFPIENGLPKRQGGAGGWQIMDAVAIYAERKIFNDWIRTQLTIQSI